MVTAFKAPDTGAGPKPYTKKQEVDTRIPPKAKPLFDQVSVNGVAIAEADILAEAQNHPAENPGEALLLAARALVVRELLWQKAQEKGLAAANQTTSGQTVLDAAITELLEQDIDVPQATQEDCRRIYDRDPSRFSSDTIWEVRHILLLADPKDKKTYEDAAKKAVSVLDMVQNNPQDFAQFARDLSACPSAKEGGNLGQISRGSTVPEFEDALKRAKAPGLVSAPVASRYGHHIVDIARIISGKVLPFDMVHEEIAAWLEASSWSKAVAQYIGILASEAHITGIEVLPHDGPLVQ